MDRSPPRNSLLAPLVVGIAGVAVGVLFAPRSGKETRQRIRDNALNMKAQAKKRIETGKARAKDVKDRFQEGMASVTDEARTGARRMQAEASRTKDQISAAAHRASKEEV